MAITPEEIVAQFRAWIEKYRYDAEAFVRDVLGVEKIEPWQSKVLAKVSKGTRKIAVRSGHGVGKTALAAWVCLWFLLTRYPVKVVITAPSKATLEDGLMAEIKKWIPMLPEHLAKLIDEKADHIRLIEPLKNAFLTMRTARPENPDALQGIHEDHVLMMVDEASGVADPIFVAGGGSMSSEGAVTMLIGNPVRASGYFDRCFNELKHLWATFTVSCFDSSRVTPEYIEEQGITYGIDSNNYRVRVLGLPPTGDDDTVIPMEWAESSVDRDVQPLPLSGIIWGLDPVRLGANESALRDLQASAPP